MSISFPSDRSFGIHAFPSGTKERYLREQESFKQDIQEALYAEGDFLTLGKSVLSLPDTQKLGIPKHIQKFRKKHKTALQQLSNKGWSGVKADLKEKMAVDSGQKASFQTVRKEYVELVQSSCLEIVRQMGYKDPGRFSAEGTPGWDSDIDTVYIAPKGMKEEDAMHVQTLFNALSAAITESSSSSKTSILSYTDSSRSFDTECYLQAGKHNPEATLTTEEGVSHFSKLELVAAHTQLSSGLLHHDPEGYEEIKQRRLLSAPDALRPTLSQSFADSEALQQELDMGINATYNRICMEQNINDANLSATERHELQGKVERIFKKDSHYALSREMDAVSENIDHCQASIRTAKEKQLPVDALEKKHDQLQAKLANLHVIRNVLFPESYHTLGSFLEVVAYEEGQSWQRAAEKAAHRTSKILSSSRPLEEAAAQGSLFQFPPESLATRLPSTLNRVSSMQENLAMYQVHFLENAEKKQATLPKDEACCKSLISTSKYMQRVMSSANQLILDSEKGDSPLAYAYPDALKTNCQECLFIASELEKCKRQKVLSTTATEALLTSEITSAFSLDASAQKALQSQVRLITDRTKDIDVTSVSPQMKLLAAVSILENLGYVQVIDADKEGNPILDNENISNILKARCGFPTFTEQKQPIQALIAVHQQGSAITLQRLHLTTAQSIESLNLRVEALANEVSNLTYQATSTADFFLPNEQDPICSLHATFLSVCGFID
ncbi:MAG: hypothetical protein JSS62_00280 [Verrucomicrobia bacterium]|nr:hypothetical protein [Verrucomicrobiota bacterium]MBS0646572.1 hypothetical protein [Verrucomicrobiota bacterium]